MESMELFYRENLCFSYGLFIYNNRNTGIPFKPSIRAAYLKKIQKIHR